ncbi:hypothetical protein ACIOWG_27420 [Streptomyces sp. NPDC087658]|uniref:hypothetical protein n=1 Tax=Streptomyces sp. NPDC087658 TaxID=3365800 RepID=UPI0037F22098
MQYIETESARGMEIFVTELIPVFLSFKAEVLIDLYIDEPIDSERTAASLEAMKGIVARDSDSSKKRKFFQKDEFMGIEVDLAHGGQAAEFSRLAHRVINTEAWCEGRQVFGTIESPAKVWVDMPDEVIERVISAASAAGAIFTSDC